MRPALTSVYVALQQAAKQKAIKQGQEYSGDDLKKIVIGMSYNDFLALVREEPPEVKSGPLRIRTQGGRKNRRYVFSEQDNLGSTSIFPDQEPDGQQKSGNDAPEDRYHIAAHIALMEQLRCVGISQPKKTINKKSDNPDIIGIIAQTQHDAASVSLAWAGRVAPNPILFVGCEVKPELDTPGKLYEAVIEARHNCRHFDVGYLVGYLSNKDRVFEAADLAAEYGIGVINVVPPDGFRSAIVYPAQMRRNENINRFFSAERSQAKDLAESLSKLRDIAKDAGTQGDIIWSALMGMLTDQSAISIVPRLPPRVRKGLEEGHPETVSDFCAIAVRLLISAYEMEAEDISLADMLARKEDGGKCINDILRGKHGQIDANKIRENMMRRIKMEYEERDEFIGHAKKALEEMARQ